MLHNHTFSERNTATKTAGGMWREGEEAEKNLKKMGTKEYRGVFIKQGA